ncbi:MAG: tetratricopeptide repeat protein [Dysgonamonadaceae bacterium]
MKKTVLALSLASGLQLSVHAQKTVESELPYRLFQQGKEMYLDKNYQETLHRLEEFKKISKDRNLLVEADYMIISTYYYQGNPNALNLLKDYLDTYPETYHRQELAFFIGSSHFEAQEWKKAIYWLTQSDLDYLDPSQQEDHSFRLAYSYIQERKYDEAYRLLGILSQKSKKYKDDASYYKAFIDFQQKKYEASTPVFERLVGSPKYKELASFYLMQTAFIQGNQNDAITRGEAFLRDYPGSGYKSEAFRILGNSYFRKGNMASAVNNYESYLQHTDKPFREDILFLGSAYNALKNYTKASDVLKQAVSYSDETGQEAYMQLGIASEKSGKTAEALLAFQAASKMHYNRGISERALYNYAMLTHNSSIAVFDQSVSVFQQFLQQYPNSQYSDNVNEALASTLLSTKNYPAALSAISAIKSPDKRILEAKQMILLQLGIQQFINGNTIEAIQRFNETIAMGTYHQKAKNQAYFWRGEAFYKIANYLAATRDYEIFISQATSGEENYTLAYYDLGYAYFKQSQYAKSKSAFITYTNRENDKLRPNYSDALNRIGDANLFARNYTEATSFYTRAANQNPTNADYSEFQKAFVQGLQRDYTGKIATLDNLMAKYPNSQYYDDALFEKSRALAMLDREKEAIPVLEKLLQNYPGTVLAQKAGVQLGQMYYNVNEPQKAIAAYKTVVKEHPESDEARIAIQSMEGIFRDINDVNSYASYVNSLGNGVHLSTSRQDSLTFLAAENIYMKGQKASAKEAFLKYLQTYPNGNNAANSHYYLGVIAQNDKDNDTALNEYRQSIDKGSNRFMEESLQAAADLEYDKQNYDKAYLYYNRLNLLTVTAETKEESRIGMMRSAAKLGKDQEVVLAATQLITQAKTAPETQKEAYFYRAQSLLNLKETEKGIADLKECASDTRYVQGAQAQFLLADIYFKWKSYDKAIAQVNDFMKRGTPHQYWMARALIVLSDAYTAKGDKFSAKQYLETLKDNYKGKESDITEMVSTRLSKMN